VQRDGNGPVGITDDECIETESDGCLMAYIAFAGPTGQEFTESPFSCAAGQQWLDFSPSLP
jgi:hypothetical protein